MPLRGELDSVDLAHVFQMLVLNQKAGALEIEHAGVKRRIYFVADGVQVPCDRGLLVDRAVRALVRANRLERAQVERARLNMPVLRKDLLATLVEMKLIDADARLRAVRQQLEEDVYELFFLRDATFEFRDGEGPQSDDDFEPGLTLSPNGLIMEAARRVDEWEYIRKLVPSGAEVLEAAGDLSALEAREADAEMRAVFAAVDGVRTIDELVEATGIARFVTFRKVALLVERELVAPVPVPRLLERAQERLAAGDATAAVNLYERAIALGAAEVKVLAGAGQAYESLGQAARAAGRYLAAGRAAEEGGDVAAALRLYQRVRKLLPTQVEARERLFALRKLAIADLGADAYDAVAEGGELAEILYQLGRREELALVLAGLLDLAGGEPAATERISDLAARLGQAGVAVESLQKAADQRAARRDFAGAISCLRKAQAIDPSRRGLEDGVRRFQDRVRARRERRRASVRVLAMVGVAGLFFLGYGRFSSAALDAYAERSIEDFIYTHSFAEGREFYGGICRRYPLTIPFLLALENLRELEVAEVNAEEVEKFRQEVEQEDEESRHRQARAFREAALSARHTGDFAAACDLLRRARALTGAEDPLNLAPDIEALEDYLAGARRLKSEAAFFRNAGRFEDAHRRLVKLLASFPSAPEARDLTVPVRVTTEPAHARISIDDVPVRIGDDRTQVLAETPFVLDLPADRAVRLGLEADGRVRLELRLDAGESGEVHAILPLRPELEAVLPHAVAGPPAADAEAVALALESGRVAFLRAATLETTWLRELPDLAEATAAPLLLPDALLLPVSNRRLLVLDRGDGAVRRTLDLAGRPVTPPAFSGGHLAIGLDGGGLALGRLDGGALATVSPPAAMTCGPLALPGGRFAVGGADGRVWLLAGDGSFSAVRLPATAGVTVLAGDGERLFCGDEQGTVHVLDLAGGKHLRSIPALPGRALETLAVDGDVVVCGGAGDVAAVDASHGVRRAVLEGQGLTLAGGAGCIAVAAADGTLRLLRAEDLAERARFAAGAPATFAGVAGPGGAFFPAAGGKLVGIVEPD